MMSGEIAPKNMADVMDTKAMTDIEQHLSILAMNVDMDLRNATKRPVNFAVLVWSGHQVRFTGNIEDQHELKRALRTILDGWPDDADPTPAHTTQQ